MPECHQCHLDGTGSRECLKCAAKDVRRWKSGGQPDTQHNHGRTHVSVDEVAGFVPAPEPQTGEYETNLDAAVSFVRALCGLGLIEREILFSRLVGTEYPDITRRLNRELGIRITVQAVHFRAKKALTDPAFRHLFRSMFARQARRKTGHAAEETPAPIENTDPTAQNIYKLPGLLARQAELEASVLDTRSKSPQWRMEATKRMADIKRRITEAWKFPLQVNPAI